MRFYMINNIYFGFINAFLKYSITNILQIFLLRPPESPSDSLKSKLLLAGDDNV